MKRILSTVLVFVLITTLIACNPISDASSEPKTNTISQTENKQSNAKDILDNSNIKTENNPAPSKPIKSEETQSSTTITTCSHQYTNVTTPPTCTSQGYTTHTCIKCNYSFSDNYIVAGHNFSNYKCTLCGKIDKTHTYEYFVNWILENGTPEGKYCTVSHFVDEVGTIAIAYEPNSNSVFLTFSWLYYDKYEYYSITTIIIDKISSSYYYGKSFENKTFNSYVYDFSGYLNSNKFTVNTQLSYETWKSDIGDTDYSEALDVACKDISTILVFTHFMLSGEVENFTNSGLTLSDLGFSSFVMEDYIQ